MNHENCRGDLFVQCLDKTRHIYSQNSKYGYLNSTNMIVMVTATINANVKLDKHSRAPKSKNLEANRG